DVTSPTRPSALPELRSAALGESIGRLCSLGNRFVGTRGEALARELIADELARATTAVRLEELTVLSYRPHLAVCALSSGEELPAVGLQFTASGVVDGEAVYVGSPEDPVEIERFDAEVAQLRDRIVVLHSYWPFGFAEAIAERRAAALIVFADTPDG